MPRVNFQQVVLPSAARTASKTVAMPVNRRHTGCLVILSITAASGTGGLTLKILEKDPISGNTIELLADTTPITATGTYGFELNPSEGTASNGVRVASSRHLGEEYSISVTAGDASSYTYSVSNTLFV